MPQLIKMELQSDNDIFFYYKHLFFFEIKSRASSENFQYIKESQELHCSFEEYATISMKSLNKVIREPSKFQCIFNISEEGLGRLQIMQVLDYKSLELISFDLEPANEEEARQRITYRYGSLKSKLALMEARLHDVSEILRVKNPSLLLQLQKQVGKKKKF